MMDELGQVRDLRANEMLFAAGDDSNAVYLVIDGSLEVVHSTEAGDLVVGTLGPTEIVGEITAVIGGRRTATVRAADGPVTVREFSADEYASWLQDRPEGHSVLPTTLEGRVAVLCAVLVPVPFLGVAMFGALIFLVLAARKGDRGLLLVLPLLASIVVAMFAVVVVFQIPGA